MQSDAISPRALPHGGRMLHQVEFEIEPSDAARCGQMHSDEISRMPHQVEFEIEQVGAIVRRGVRLEPAAQVVVQIIEHARQAVMARLMRRVIGGHHYQSRPQGSSVASSDVLSGSSARFSGSSVVRQWFVSGSSAR